MESERFCVKILNLLKKEKPGTMQLTIPLAKRVCSCASAVRLHWPGVLCSPCCPTPSMLESPGRSPGKLLILHFKGGWPGREGNEGGDLFYGKWEGTGRTGFSFKKKKKVRAVGRMVGLYLVE